MKRNFQIEEDGGWFQVLTALSTWYVVSHTGNRVCGSLLDLPQTWQAVMVAWAIVDQLNDARIIIDHG